MAKMNLLKLTQKILSALDSDEVNSISDTVESAQVVEIIENTYYNLISNYTIPEHRTITNLTALGDTDRPTHFQYPTGVDRIYKIQYNTIDISETHNQYTDMIYMSLSDFLEHLQGRDNDDSNIQVVEDYGVKFHIIDDAQPKYWTSVDDDFIIMDSFDSDTEATLQSSKSLIIANKEPTWTDSDVFIPDLDSDLFPMLLAEATSVAFVELKQTSNPKAEQASRRQQIRIQNDRVKKGYDPHAEQPNYGRR